MRKILLYLCIVFLVSCSFNKPIDPEIKEKLKKLNTSSYTIKSASDYGKYFNVTIQFNYKPTNIEVVSGGLGVCGQVLQILENHSMEKDISVAVTSPTRVKDKVFFYGSAEYSRITGEFNWEPYKK